MPSMLTDVFRTHPIHLPNTGQSDFTSLRELPDSYTWTTKDDFVSPNSPGASTAGESLPVIDLSDPQKALALINHASQTWGAFQITNHGVPTRLLDDIEFVTSSLFRLPAHRKMEAARQENGISGYGVARIAPFFNKQMWSEGFTIAGSPLEDFRLLWPHNHSKYCDIVEEYGEAMQNLARRLMWLMLGSLGVTQEDIKWAETKSDSQAAIQLNHYPICPDPNRAMGLAAHTDSTLLTVLYQSNTAGLQVYKEGSGWFTVPTLPGSLIVNIGDLLHILTNGKYQSALHRVRVNQTRSRFSVAYLWGPELNAEISPLPKLVSPVNPLLYRSVTWKEYLGIKAKHFDKALSTIRVYSPIKGLVNMNSDRGIG